MTLTAYIQQPAPRRHARAQERRTIRLDAAAGDERVPAVVHDLSRSGLLLESDGAWSIGDRVDIDLPDVRASATIIWRDKAHLGCQFATPLTQAQVSAALLRSEPVHSVPANDGRGLADALTELADMERRADNLRQLVRERCVHLGRPQPAGTSSAFEVLAQRADEASDAADQDDRLSFSNRLRIILAAAAVAWAVILWTSGAFA